MWIRPNSSVVTTARTRNRLWLSWEGFPLRAGAVAEAPRDALIALVAVRQALGKHTRFSICSPKAFVVYPGNS